LRLPLRLKDQLENFSNANDVSMSVIEMHQSQNGAPARLTDRERFMPEILLLNLFREYFDAIVEAASGSSTGSARRSGASV
jgi:hypothetical protein